MFFHFWERHWDDHQGRGEGHAARRGKFSEASGFPVAVESERSMKSTSPVAVVVNDDRIQLQVLSRLVKQAGLRARSFLGAEAALAAMDPNAPPAVIVSDVHMPGIDGWRSRRQTARPSRRRG